MIRVAKPAVGLLALVVLTALAAPARAGFVVDPDHPIIGEQATVTLLDADDQPLAGAPVTATYYPGSAVEKTVDVGTTDDAGQLRWTPEHAGLATLASGDASQTLGVRFGALPARGLIVFLVAGSLLFGAIFFGSRLILRGDYVDPTT